MTDYNLTTTDVETFVAGLYAQYVASAPHQRPFRAPDFTVRVYIQYQPYPGTSWVDTVLIPVRSIRRGKQQPLHS